MEGREKEEFGFAVASGLFCILDYFVFVFLFFHLCWI